MIAYIVALDATLRLIFAWFEIGGSCLIIVACAALLLLGRR